MAEIIITTTYEYIFRRIITLHRTRRIRTVIRFIAPKIPAIEAPSRKRKTETVIMTSAAGSDFPPKQRKTQLELESAQQAQKELQLKKDLEDGIKILKENFKSLQKLSEDFKGSKQSVLQKSYEQHLEDFEKQVVTLRQMYECYKPA